MPDWYGDHSVTRLDEADPHLAWIQRFPVKSLDPEDCEVATLTTAGALDGDREWAILDRPPGEPYDPDTADVTGSGDYVNGKKTDAVHRLWSQFVPCEEGGPAVAIRRREDDPDATRLFPLYDGRAGDNPADEADVHADLNGWLSEYFRRPVSVRWDGRGQHDDRERHGPTVVSTATLREVAAWFDFDVESARRRFRANLEIGGVPPFWEDRLFTDEGSVVPFRVGDATVEGVHPCQRCVVPGRDPNTGEETSEFRETFIERREETLPDWTDCDRFDHAFRLMVNTRVSGDSDGERVAVGDAVEIRDSRSA
jgi:uncharacterized protein YcbX